MKLDNSPFGKVRLLDDPSERSVDDQMDHRSTQKSYKSGHNLLLEYLDDICFGHFLFFIIVEDNIQQLNSVALISVKIEQ